MSAIKPEIYISWIPRGQIEIKPEVYISWIPRGQIEVKPEIYASIITAPHNEKISADTCRTVKNLDNSNADTFRQIAQSENLQADTKRNISKTENNSSDTLRKIGVSENIFADTLRNVEKLEFISVDTKRNISNVEKIIADTCREVETNFAEIFADTLIRNACNENISAKTLREIVSAEKICGDSFRKLNQSAKIFADTLLKKIRLENISADTKIVTSNIEIISADTSRQIQMLEIISADTERNLLEFISADTHREVVKVEKIVADTKISIPHKLLYTVNSPLVNTFKDYGLTALNITLQEKTLSDTFQLETVQPMEINDAVTGKFLDYEFNFLVEETNRQNLVQSVKGIFDQDKILYTRIKLARTIIERKSQQISGNTSLTTIYYSAGVILRTLADYMEMTLNLKIDDFIPYNLEPDTNATYNSFISTLFGWTSRVPQRQINVFIRGGVIHAIQRGMEESVFDISDLPHTRPVVNQKLLRTMWHSSDYVKVIEDEEDEDPVVDYEYEDIITPFTGTISYSDDGVYHELVYSKGLLVKETSETSNSQFSSTSTTHYDYIEIFPEDKTDLEIFLHKIVGDFYLSSKTTNTRTKQYGTENLTYTDSENQTKTSPAKNDKLIKSYAKKTYKYSSTGKEECYLLEEYEVDKKETYEYQIYNSYGSANWQLTFYERNTQQTFHTPLGNGWYGQSVYRNGEAVGSNISQGKPGNKVTQYTIIEVQKKLKGFTIKVKNKDKDKNKPKNLKDQYAEWRKSLSPIVDITFPVREIAKLYELTAELKKLNRSIQEEISLSVTDNILNGVPQNLHVIDFTERILLDGKEYFLVSNNISFKPKKFVQNLKLIRWIFKEEN